jgi:hypothetical protein
MVCKADTRVYTGSRMALYLVDSTATCVVLHRSARSRVTSFRERERILGLFRCVCVCCLSEVCVRHLKEFVLIRESP